MTVILPAWDAPQFKYSLLDLTINRQRKEQHIHLETGCLKLYKPQKVQFTNLHISGWVWGFRYTFQMPSPNKSCPNTKGLTHFKGRITTFFFFLQFLLILYMPKIVLNFLNFEFRKIRWKNIQEWESLRRSRYQNNKRYYGFFSSSKIWNLRAVAVNSEWLEGPFLFLLRLLRVHTRHMTLASGSIQTFWYLCVCVYMCKHTYRYIYMTFICI